MDHLACNPPPLAAWNAFCSRDPDEARVQVAQKFCDHRLAPGGPSRRFDAVHNHVRGQAVSLNYMRYGSAVTIDPGALGSFYLVQVPLSGMAEVISNGAAVDAGRQVATVLNPTRETRMTWGAGCEKLLLQIGREALHAVAEKAVGHRLAGPVVFATGMPFEREGLRRWRRQLAACVQATDAGRGMGAWPAAQQALIEEQLILGLLQSQPSNISHFFDAAVPEVAPVQLRRAQEHILQNLGEALTVGGIAAAAGCSIRSLQLAFQTHLDCTPIEYLRDRRLDLAHYLLQSADPETPVRSIAYDCGFSHLGRFAQAYRSRFGQPPSATLGTRPEICRLQ
ncbi:AraC family transcriptional regulator [Roseobacteraceae bacterium NS-SX3]